MTEAARATKASAAKGADRYVLGELLSAGGMASVHLGRLAAAGGFGRTVAVKRLHPQFASDPNFVAMMLDEARLVSRIRHPNVVVPLDVVEDEGGLLLVLEYVHGATLAELAQLLGGAPCPLPIARAILSAVLVGLHAAHEAKREDGAALGIVHRDVSPQNVMVGADGDVRVLDFGIARAADASHQSEAGEVKGKVAYMAPEQLAGGAVTASADIYGASVVAWELLTGRRLFEGALKSQIPFLVASGAVRSPTAVAPELPEEMVDLVMKGLAKEPAHRFPSARAMAEAVDASGPVATPRELAAWVGELAKGLLAAKAEKVARLEQGSSPGGSASSPVALPPPSVRTAMTATGDSPVRSPRGRTGPGLALGVAVVVASIASAGAFVVRRTFAPAAAPSAAPAVVAAESAAPSTESLAPTSGPSASPAASAPSSSGASSLSAAGASATPDRELKAPRRAPPRSAKPRPASSTERLFERN